MTIHKPLLALSLLISASACIMRGNHVLETWEPTNQSVKVRVTKSDVWPPLAWGLYYLTVEAAQPDSGRWHEVLTWVADDPSPIPRQQVRFVSAEIAYAFGIHEFVVTTDRGQTWVKWNAALALDRLGLRSFPKSGITSVEIAPDGNGKIAVQHQMQTAVASKTFTTADFGKHWTPE